MEGYGEDFLLMSFCSHIFHSRITLVQCGRCAQVANEAQECGAGKTWGDVPESVISLWGRQTGLNFPD